MSEPSEVYGKPVGRSQTLQERLHNAADSYPDGLALVSVHQPAGLYQIPNQPLDEDNFRQSPYLRWSHRDLRDGVRRLVRGLRSVGVRPGMPLFAFNNNCAEHTLASRASIEIGCVFVPINPRNFSNREEVIFMVNTASSVTPGQRPVVVTSSPELTTQIDELGVFGDAVKVVASSAEATPSWLSFEMLMSPQASPTADSEANSRDKVVDGLVIFTSGTTSRPKGCFTQYPMLNHTFEADALDWMSERLRPDIRYCCIVPNNHAMGNWSASIVHSYGGAVIYPGPGFEADVVLRTLYREKVTHISLVPTMVNALIGLKATVGHHLEHLSSVIFGGAVLTPESIKTCMVELGAKHVVNAFGMTEGVLIATGPRHDINEIIDGEEVSVGWVQPGVALRVADPDTYTALPRNSLGELHVSNAALRGYIGGVGDEAYYHDKQDGRLWFKTGDQARMDDTGRIFITGRYKDMIIRGGENMSPTAIEAAISRDPQLARLNPQIVAAPDAIAGEVPIAVVTGNIDTDTKEAVKNTVSKNMGLIYVPEDVLSLEDLGLADYPRTLAGKIQKVKLAALVRSVRAKRDSTSQTRSDSELVDLVKDAWAKIVGLDPSRLLLDAPIGEFADSISIMRVRDSIRRKTGKTLSLADMANAGTIAGHIDLLRAPIGEVKSLIDIDSKRQGPPGVDDIAHFVGDAGLLGPTRDLVLSAISPHGFDWNDVEDVIPASDFISVITETGLWDSRRYKFSTIFKKADKTQARGALERMLRNNRLLASFLVRDRGISGPGDALHVTIRHDNKLFGKVFQDGGSLKTIEELRAKALGSHDQVCYPGPLVRITLYDIEETGTAGALMRIDHAVMDASAGLIFIEDLERALADVPLTEHTDYKLWADSYFNQRTSAEAMASVKWHRKALERLESHREALWPPFTMPTDDSQPNIAEAAQQSFEAPGLASFRKKHPGITATAILRAALTLLNIQRTGHTHALFCNWEAARATFPFLPRAVLASGAFEATDVSGPTMQVVMNLVEVKADENVVSLLGRMQEEQKALSKHASAPLREVMSALGPAGAMVPEIIGHQAFNWQPGMATTGTSPHAEFELLKAENNPHVGLTVAAGIGGPNSCTFFIRVRGTSFTQAVYDGIAADLEKISLWLLAEENWGRPVMEYVAALQ